jgi:undecaprenyl-diphosphatase
MDSSLQNQEAKADARQKTTLELFLGFIICAAALLLFSLLAKNIIGNSSLVQLDQNVATALHAWATPNSTLIFEIISLLGFQVLWGVVAVVALYYTLKRYWIHLIVWLAGYVGAELLNALLKMAFNRPRPFFTDPLLTAANASFPSGHAMVSLVVYGLLAFFILLQVKSAWARSAIILGTILLVLLIGISRLYLGVHYFSDVAAGYVGGVIWLTICINAMNVAEARKSHHTAKLADAKP